MLASKIIVTCLALITGLSASAHAQQLGRVETFGSDGRQFSAGPIDYFLLTRQSYATEDSTGYEGDVRAVRKYDGGGYQIILKHYTARCVAPFDHGTQVIWSTPGDDSEFNSVDIVNPGKFPRDTKKESYNLYWAACKNVFQKFR